MSFRVLYKQSAARQIQRERAWLAANRGHGPAGVFEEELDHARELLEECPEMGAPSRWSKDERCVFLRRSRFHVFYRLYREDERIVVMRLLHEKQRPRKL
jgi:plasmid stabilization system protein ParE